MTTITRTKREDPAESPRLDTPESRTRLARREWEETWSNLAAGKRNWMVAFFAAMAVVAMLVVALWHVSTLSKTDMYVLQRDSDNNVSYAGPVKPSDMDEATWDKVKIQSLKRFIESWRTVTADRTAQDNMWDRSFFYTGDGSQAKVALSKWYEDHDPIKIAEGGNLVTVQYKTFDREGKNTFGIWWQETTTSSTGQIVSQKMWRARIAYVMRVPTSEKAREENGLGILATELQFEPVQ